MTVRRIERGQRRRENVQFVESVGSLIAAAARAAGPTVADTSIRHLPREGRVRLGGVDITNSLLGGFDYHETRNVTIPRTWPTLDVKQFKSRRDPFALPTFGFAVLAQVSLLADEGSRAALSRAAFAVAGLADAPLVHSSTLTNETTGVTCRTAVRRGATRPGLPLLERAVLLVSGPEVASSGIVMWAPSTFDGVAALTGDTVASICGSRPPGL